jgi:hypothetical protein
MSAAEAPAALMASIAAASAKFFMGFPQQYSIEIRSQFYRANLGNDVTKMLQWQYFAYPAEQNGLLPNTPDMAWTTSLMTTGWTFIVRRDSANHLDFCCVVAWSKMPPRAG